MTISCVITDVKCEEFSVDLTHKSSTLRQREKALVLSFLALLVQKYKYCRRRRCRGSPRVRSASLLALPVQTYKY